MADLMENLALLEDACQNPRARLEHYLAQGKQVVGCFAPYAPEELVHACGMIPMGMWGGHVELKLAKSYLPAFACPVMQSNMELGLKGAYRGLSAVIIPALCDTLRCMTQNWRFGVTDIPMIPIVYPQNRTSPASVDYLVSEFETVLTMLYTITGHMMNEHALEESIQIYNEHNQVMREFEQLANQHLDVVTPSTEFPVRRMSGGNVQKVLVGREIAQDPAVLMTAYAVRGLDINTSYTIYNLLTEEKMKGVAVVYVGEDLDVLLELCDRILVLCGGQVSGIVDARTADKRQLGTLMTRVGGGSVHA